MTLVELAAKVRFMDKPNELLTVKEVAKRLRCGRTLVWRLMRDGKLAYFEISPRVRRVSCIEVQRLLAAGWSGEK